MNSRQQRELRAAVAAVAGLTYTTNTLAQEVACSALAAPGQFANTTIESTKLVPADAEPSAPAHCEVTGTIKPNEGSSIGVIYRLPTSWNGKMLGIGGGGFAGDITLRTAIPGLAKGYAVAQTDTGHKSPQSLDPSWALSGPGELNKEAVIDFGHRAVHLMTRVGKEVIARHYGRPHQRAYFEGCSTGGRQGLAEIQRYPDDYDGIVAGAPVYNTIVYTSAVLRTQHFHKTPGSNLAPEHIPLLAGAVLKACDALDGVTDGILTDPRQCKWDPAELQCTGAAGPTCLTPAQVQTVRKMYQGVRAANGAEVAAPITHGAEPDWATRSVGNPQVPLGVNSVLGSPFISILVKQWPNYDLFSFDPNRDVEEIDRSFAAQQIVAKEPNLTPFFAHGGKLILWHGFNDPGPSPLQTIKYYEAVAEATTGKTGQAAIEAVTANARLFLAPGVYHCRGGPGTDRFDALSALDEWVERGVAPERIMATKANSNLSRPLCPYPLTARYNGSGDQNDAANFTCSPAAQ
jgi:feruloyl esterase